MKEWKWFKPLTIMRLALSLLIAGQGIPVSELMAAAPIRIRVACPYSGGPTAVTSINAVPDFSVPEKAGGVQLSWSAPAIPTGDRVFSYVVKYATFSAVSSGSCDAWWNNPNTFTAAENGLPSSFGRLAHSLPGSTETMTITGLAPAVTYYFGVRARDRYFNLADYDSGLNSLVNQAQTYAAPNPWTPGKISTLSALKGTDVGAVKLSWAVPQFLDTNFNMVSGKITYPGEYCVQYSTVMPPADTTKPNSPNNWDSSIRVFVSTSNLQTGDLMSANVTGLMQPTTYYFMAFLRNEWPGHWSSLPLPLYAAIQPFNTVKPPTALGAVADASSDINIGSYASLSWTNPVNEDHLKGIRICYSTTTTPSNPSASQYIDLEPETTGQTVVYQHTQLIPRATYYYTVFAYDQYRTYSTGLIVKVYVNKDLLAPDMVNTVSSTTGVDSSGTTDRYFSTVNWTAPAAAPYYRNSDFAGVKVYFSTSTYVNVPSAQAYLTAVAGTNSQAGSFTHDNLSAFTTYYYTMFSYDAAGNASTSPVCTAAYVSGALVTPTAPKIITVLAAASVDPAVGSSLSLKWTAPVETNVSGMKIVYRTDRYPSSISDGTLMLDRPAVPGGSDSFYISQLTPMATYYIAFYAYTTSGKFSRPAAAAGFTMIPWTDNLAPMAPLGLSFERKANQQVQLNWSPVRRNADYTKFAAPEKPNMKDLYSYEIYRSTEIFGTWERTGCVLSGANSCLDKLPGSCQYYYKVRARDASGNYSDSNIIDADSYVHVPCEEGTSLALSQDKVLDNVIIAVTRDISDEKGPIVKSIEWESFKLVEGTSTLALQKVNNFTSYETVNSSSDASGLSISYMTGTDSNAKTAPALRAMSETELAHEVSIFYYNGLEWLKLSCAVDTTKKVVTAKARFSGRYQLRKAPQPTEFTFYSVMPRIITPNKDGQNDRVLFRFANPKASGITIKVFDLNGALVRKLDETRATSDIHGDYIYWDGADDSGSVVPVGVYIYQLEGEGKVINGTIVVAR